jgi:hypothetical protein
MGQQKPNLTNEFSYSSSILRLFFFFFFFLCVAKMVINRKSKTRQMSNIQWFQHITVSNTLLCSPTISFIKKNTVSTLVFNVHSFNFPLSICRIVLHSAREQKRTEGYVIVSTLCEAIYSCMVWKSAVVKTKVELGLWFSISNRQRSCLQDMNRK